MKKKFFKEYQECPKCHKRKKSLLIMDNGTMICTKCFLKLSIKAQRAKRPYFANSPYRTDKLFEKKDFSKSIYAIDGVKIVYKGGCTN